MADEIWARACASGAIKPCNSGGYYRMRMTLEVKRDFYCLGDMRGPLADEAVPIRGVPEVSPWIENVEFRCLTNRRAFIESWY